MEINILKLAVERLSDEVKSLKADRDELRNQIGALRQQITEVGSKEKETEEFLTTKQVLSMLGICYNTLQRVIGKGLITPIRINQRRVIFSKKMILDYLYSAVPVAKRP